VIAPSSSPLKTAEPDRVAANAAKEVTVNAETATAPTAGNEICVETGEGDIASTSRQPRLSPTAYVKCWNCEQCVTPEHQCGETTPALVPPVHLSLEIAPPSDAESDPCQTFTLPNPGKTLAPRRGLNIKKFCFKCVESSLRIDTQSGTNASTNLYPPCKILP